MLLRMEALPATLTAFLFGRSNHHGFSCDPRGPKRKGAVKLKNKF